MGKLTVVTNVIVGVAAVAAALTLFSGAAAAGSAGSLATRAADPCQLRYPSGVEKKAGSVTTYDRQASLYQVCEGFGAPDSGGFHLTPAMQCAIIAAAATYGGPVVSAGVSNGCTAGDVYHAFTSGTWLGTAKGVACGYFSDVFAGGVGVFAAGASSATGPGAVAVGVATYRALTAGLKLVCGGIFTGLASQLGVKLEAKHETAVALDVIRHGKCISERTRAVLGIQWSAVTCPVSASTAPASLYFFEGPSIKAAPLTASNGSSARTVLANAPDGDGAGGLAVAGGNIFWAAARGTLWMVSIHGGTPRTIATGLGDSGALASGGGYVWFVDPAGIGRVKSDGTALQRNFIPLSREYGESGVADGLASDGRYLYFSRCLDSQIGRVRFDGGGLDISYVGMTPHLYCPQGLAAGGGYVYWAQLGIGTGQWGSIGRASDTRFYQSWFVTAGDELGPYDLAFGGGYVFWTHEVAAEGPTYIGRVRTDGSGALDAWLKKPPTQSLGALAIGP